MNKCFPIALFAVLTAAVMHAANPVVSNVRARQDIGTKRVLIDYDVADADGDRLDVRVMVTVNGTPITATSFLPGSAIGLGVTPGRNRRIVWDAGVDWNGQYSSAVRFTVTADDGMVLIPAGSFQMGDNLDGVSPAQPVHTVHVSAFYMDKTEVTWAKWQEVRAYAAANGYDIGSVGSGKAGNHPVHSVNWYDCVKWCNARSQQEGLTPCYRRGGAVYKAGEYDDITCDWSADGYRLPTEAEWEKAARGGLSGRRFPWGDTISHSRANYYSRWDGGVPYYPYDVNRTAGCHPSYVTGDYPYTSPAGAFAANGYGLYDMSGNVWEWCWDWIDGYPSGSVNNPRGPSSPGGWGSLRVIRGGSWTSYAYYCRAAIRHNYWPDRRNYNFGFRAVRPRGQQ